MFAETLLPSLSFSIILTQTLNLFLTIIFYYSITLYFVVVCHIQALTEEDNLNLNLLKAPQLNT
jgi:hypothetical protein